MRKPAQHSLFLALALILAISFPAILRAESKNIRENIDPYSGLRTLFLDVPTRTCPDDPGLHEHDPDVHLLFSANESKDGTVYYFVTPTLDHGYTLNIHTQDTMDTLIDGLPGSFTTTLGSTIVTNWNGGRSYLHETVPFFVTPDDLANISLAHWFQFRVNGPKRFVQRCIDAKHLRDLPEFLSAASEYGAAQMIAPQSETPVIKSRPELQTLKLEDIATEACPGDPALGPQDANVRLTLSANQRGDGGVWYFLSTDIIHGPMLHLDRGGTIEVHLDTQTDKKSSTFHTINGSVISAAPDAQGIAVPREVTAFHVHQPNLIAMSDASMVEFRITGLHQTIHRCVDPKALQGLPKFIASTTTLYGKPVADAQQH
jgi:hypothetical protein